MSETLSPPEDEVDFLVRSLSETDALTGVKIFSDSDSLSKVTSPPRVVIYADEGQYQAPGDKTASITDCKLEFIAAIWGGSPRECRYIRTLLFRAFDEARAADADFPWIEWEQAGVEKANTGPDTTLHGAGMTVQFKALISIDRAAPREGRVDSYSLTEV